MESHGSRTICNFFGDTVDISWTCLEIWMRIVQKIKCTFNTGKALCYNAAELGFAGRGRGE